MQYLAIALIVIIGVYMFLIEPKMKENLNKKVTSLLVEGRYEEIKNILDKPATKFILMPFDIDYINYTVALTKNENDAVIKCLENFMGKNISKKKKQLVLKMGFEYAINNSNKKIADLAYDNLSKVLTQQQLQGYDLPYDIYINKGYKYLDEILEGYGNLTDEQKAMVDIPIAVMFHNKGDSAQEKKYKELYQSHIK